MNSLKSLVRAILPKPYHAAWLAKNYISHRIINPFPWEGYYHKGYWDTPEDWLSSIVLPSYIDRILDVGCAVGRNFIPFDGKLKLRGVEIVPEETIEWARHFTDLTYQHVSIEGFTKELERGDHDLSTTVVFSSGALLYCSGRQQRRFYEACKQAGCGNFIFSEYPPSSKKHPIEHFKIDWPEDEILKLRGDGDTAWQYIHLESMR